MDEKPSFCDISGRPTRKKDLVRDYRGLYVHKDELDPEPKPYDRSLFDVKPDPNPRPGNIIVGSFVDPNIPTEDLL